MVRLYKVSLSDVAHCPLRSFFRPAFFGVTRFFVLLGFIPLLLRKELRQIAERPHGLFALEHFVRNWNDRLRRSLRLILGATRSVFFLVTAFVGRSLPL